MFKFIKDNDMDGLKAIVSTYSWLTNCSNHVSYEKYQYTRVGSDLDNVVIAILFYTNRWTKAQQHYIWLVDMAIMK